MDAKNHKGKLFKSENTWIRGRQQYPIYEPNLPGKFSLPPKSTKHQTSKGGVKIQ